MFGIFSDLGVDEEEMHLQECKEAVQHGVHENNVAEACSGAGGVHS